MISNRNWNGQEMVRFAGLDGHEIAVRSPSDVVLLIGSTVQGVAVTNLYFAGVGKDFITVKGTVDEVQAIFELGNEKRDAAHLEMSKAAAERRLRNAAMVDALIREGGAFVGYKRKSYEKQVIEDGLIELRVVLEKEPEEEKPVAPEPAAA